MNASRLSATHQLERRRTVIKEIANSRLFRVKEDGTILTQVDIAGHRIESWRLIEPLGKGVRFFLYRGFKIQIHLVVWVHFKGYLPRNLTVGFRDGDPSNVQLQNLWLVPHADSRAILRNKSTGEEIILCGAPADWEFMPCAEVTP